MLYSGIDLHKRTVAIHTLDAADNVIRKGACPIKRALTTIYLRRAAGPASGRGGVYGHVVRHPRRAVA